MLEFGVRDLGSRGLGFRGDPLYVGAFRGNGKGSIRVP